MRVFFCLLMLLGLGANSYAQMADPAARANRLYFMMTSKPLIMKNPQYKTILDLVRSGQERQAVTLMMADPDFLNSVARTWAVRYLTAGKATSQGLTDSLAMTLGLIRDNRDFRELVTGDFTYGAADRLGLDPPSPSSNDIFSRIDASHLNMTDALKRIEPQWNLAQFKESSGVLTSRAWGETYYTAGTNRRGVVGAFEVLLCKPIESWKTPFLPTDWIRRDVARDPSGDPRIFQQECRSCHAPMDGFAGAFAFLNYNGGLTYSSTVEPKYNQNAQAYPDGHVTTGSDWVNFLNIREQIDFGWRGSLSGTGVKAFGTMVSQAKAFSRCVAVRSLKYFCAKNYSLSDPVVDQLSTDFENSDQYRVQDFFSRVVTSEQCK